MVTLDATGGPIHAYGVPSAVREPWMRRARARRIDWLIPELLREEPRAPSTRQGRQAVSAASPAGLTARRDSTASTTHVTRQHFNGLPEVTGRPTNHETLRVSFVS